jgi:amino acid transporter
MMKKFGEILFILFMMTLWATGILGLQWVKNQHFSLVEPFNTKTDGGGAINIFLLLCGALWTIFIAVCTIIGVDET